MEFVSTEKGEITEVSKKYGAEVLFIRPKELAEDNEKGIEVVLHAIDWLKKMIIESNRIYYVASVNIST